MRLVIANSALRASLARSFQRTLTEKLIIILLWLAGYEVVDTRLVGYNHFISSNPEQNYCFIKSSVINNSFMLIIFGPKMAKMFSTRFIADAFLDHIR